MWSYPRNESAGAVVNAEDKYGRTVLSHAARVSHVNVARVLIKRGAAIENTDSDGWTPLFHAAKCGHMEIVRALIKHGTAVSVKSKPSDSHCVDTPVTLAGRAGHMRVFQTLIESGALINVRSGNGETPLISAAQWDFFAVVQLLFAGDSYYLRDEDMSEDEYPLLDGSLATMHQMCSATFELESILLLEIENRKSRLSRFIGSRAITNQIQDFHEELGHFAETVEYTDKSDWKQQ